MANYSEKLRDPRWQKKRLEVFERDGWCCRSCGDESSTLNIHHKIYLRNKNPWEYPIELLVTLCESCHENETLDMKDACDFIAEAFKRNFFSYQISEMAEHIQTLELQHAAEVVATVLGNVFSDIEMQKELIERYFEKLAADRIEREKNG